MRIRNVAMGVFASVLLASGTLSPVAQAQQDDVWKSLTAKWPGRQAVSVNDVAALGKVAYVAATTTKGAMETPWVQVCGRATCKNLRLPRPGGNSTRVTSISGSDKTDIWAVGTTKSGNENRPVFWHNDGTGWTIMPTEFDNDIALVEVEVANKSKAYAVGRRDYGGGVTSTLYRWNGTGWKEISPLLADPADFPQPCDGWYNRDWADVITRPGVVILVGTCGPRAKPVVLEQGAADWDLVSGHGLPDKVRWDVGSFVGQQAWMTGLRKGKRFFVARDGNEWKRISIEGLRANAVITDVAGLFASKVTAVGYIPSGRGHKVARAWKWGAGSWHETEVPTGVSKSRLVAVSIDSKGPNFAVGTDSAQQPHRRGIILRAP